ncbi:hypothetical protein AURDEDRAFT_180216 [Auricularia subglabra TFB-10046 SS5]|nr:hypothetical protein AURDEDRAFT_180216 [Auricularia subglabra TFB-10046 SS5]
MAEKHARPSPRKELDLAEKMIAYQRRNAAASASRPRAARPSQAPVQEPAAAATPDPEDFSRRLKISSGRTRELYRPDVDPIPLRRSHEHTDSDHAAASSPPHAHHPHAQQRSPRPGNAQPAQHRQLFDPARDDPLRFAKSHQPAQQLQPQPQPSRQQQQLKSSASRHMADWMSVSSASVSSSAPSVLSSVLTLTSNTTGSTGSSPHQKTDDVNSWLTQIKKLYRDLSACEAKLSKDLYPDQEESKVVLKTRTPASNTHNERILRMIADHKHFAEICHTFLKLTLSPLVPASVHAFPSRCNIPARLWAAIQRPLEVLRLMSSTSAIALEHLSDFIYYAYGYYTMLYEEPLHAVFKSFWLEALGDLARYRMALAAHLTPSPTAAPEAGSQTLASLPAPEPAPARIDASPSPSIGVAALASFDLEPERDQWRNIARGWYGDGLKDQPGNGKLHHHIGLLCREDETLIALYHYAKSMTALHPFSTARESVQGLFGAAVTSKRLLPEAKAADLFVVLHGMLFTHIQLDDFDTVLARFLEKLQLDSIEEREWIMMGVTNLAAVLDYGRPTGVLRKTGAFGEKKEKESDKPRAGVKRKSEQPVSIVEDEDLTRKMDVDEPEDAEDAAPETPADAAGAPQADDELPISYTLALRLTFSMFSYVLRNPKHRRTPFTPSTLNPYIPLVFTFLATMARHPRALAVMERAIPWDDMATFLAMTPRSVLAAEVEAGLKLTSGCDPSPEDWCLRGMEWLGRRVYERGFWARAEKGGEMEVLLAQEANFEPADDGIIEDDSDEANHAATSTAVGNQRRWTRVCRAAGILGKAVPGFVWQRETRRWVVTGPLREKVQEWAALERQLSEKQARSWADEDMDDEMDIDEEDQNNTESSEEDDDEDEQVKALRARRRYLRSLLQDSNKPVSPVYTRRARRHGMRGARRSLQMIPGYTVLVVDTNILLSSLPLFSGLVTSQRWTVIVPLAVITELDGLAQNHSPLGQAAKEALKFITSSIRTCSSSLKVQTSKGNYLSSLVVRSEQVQFSKHEGSWERNMDDLILRSALWQLEHWVDRSSLLPGASNSNNMVDDTSSRVVLLTFDRNLRLKAASRQLDAADEKDMAAILTPAT